MKLRFGIVADPHYADTDTRGTRFFRESKAKLAECVEDMNRQKVDFLIELGDFKDQDEPPDAAKTLQYLQTIEGVFARFNGPRYHVIGNHDLDSLSKAQFQAHIDNSGIPSDQTYYSFDHGGLHFIVLDANFSGDGAPHNNGDFDWTDVWIPPDELAWLKQDLAAVDSPVIVFTHQLLDGEDKYCINNATEVRSVLEAHGRVLAVFQGHRHTESYNRISDIPYYTLHAMVEKSGVENTAYVVVEVHDDLSLVVRD